MITTYWRIPNIFTISQEHKGKTTGNGANFPTLHSNKPERRSEKINVETRRRRRLDPPKSDLGSPGESTVGLPPCSEGAERRGSNVQGFHSSALQQNPAPGSLLRKEDRDLGGISPSLGSPRRLAFSQPRRQRTSSSGWLTPLGAGQPEAVPWQGRVPGRRFPALLGQSPALHRGSSAPSLAGKANEARAPRALRSAGKHQPRWLCPGPGLALRFDFI